MRHQLSRIVVASAIAFGGLACANSYNVRTMTAPKTTLTEFHTFSLLPTPRRRDGQIPSGTNDPMVSNSITNRALRASVADALRNRGYGEVERNPDFVVGVYASAREKLDLTQWQFGYSAWPRWWWVGVPPQGVRQYDEGTVVVDVIDPHSLDLLWRGTATAELGDNPESNSKALQKAAAAIIGKFPPAKPGAVVAHR